MTLEQSYLPKSSYCIMCERDTKGETCSDTCRDKLEFLRSAIKQRIEDEKMGARVPDQKAVRDLNRIQDYIGK